MRLATGRYRNLMDYCSRQLNNNRMPFAIPGDKNGMNPEYYQSQKIGILDQIANIQVGSIDIIIQHCIDSQS